MPKVATMPKKPKPERVESEGTSERRKTSSVQIAEDLARWSVIIATQRKMKVSDLLDPILRPYLSESVKAIGKAIQTEADKEPEGN